MSKNKRVLLDSPIQMAYTPMVSAQAAGKPRVDREKEIIYNVAIACIGIMDTMTGTYEFDGNTLDKIVEYGTAAGNAAMSRFNHPAYSNPGLGKLIGTPFNFRRDGDVVRADFQISPTSHNVPGMGDIGGYILDLAEKEPEKCGVSIVANGYITYQTDSSGEWIPPLFEPSDFIAGDMVDVPASRISLAASAAQGDDSHGFFQAMKRFFTGTSRVEESAVHPNPQLEENTMDLTLETLQAGYPALVSALKAEFEAGNQEPIAAQIEAARADGEKMAMDRVKRIMSHAKAEHYAATDAYPKGLVCAAIETGMPYVEYLEAAIELSGNATLLTAMAQESEALKVPAKVTDDHATVTAGASYLQKVEEKVKEKQPA